MYNFDELIDRSNSNSFKWEKYSDKNIIPLWVADMDFKAATPILESLHQITEQGILGYTKTPSVLIDVIVERLQSRHAWEIKKEWIVFLPGLVPGIHASCRAVGKNGDAIMSVSPVYMPFVQGIHYANKQHINVPLLNENGLYKFDFSKIKERIKEVKMFLLCNPHNPNGRVFDRDELQKLLDICLENDVIICSDEIHNDLILDKSKTHISIASMSKLAENQTITLLSPNKAFNIAGLGCSFAIIPNDEIRANFEQSKFGIMPENSPYAYAAALAAYHDVRSDIWLKELLDYLKINHVYLLDEINQIKGMKMMPLEATYLAWIDVRELKMPNIVEVLEKAGVGVMGAQSFMDEGFIRINFATQKVRLEEAVRRIKVALN